MICYSDSMVDEHQRRTVTEAVRPKRHTRHPAYFDDFEVDYGGHHPSSEPPHSLSTARYEHRQEQTASPRAQSFIASRCQTSTRKLPEVTSLLHEQITNSALKGQISTSAPPTLYGKGASLDLHASPSYVVSPVAYSLPARTLHHSVSAVNYGANDPSYPPQQQRASLTEPHSMTSLIDKMMGQLQFMREVVSRHGTPSRTPQPYKEPPPVHYENPDLQWYAHSPQYAAHRAYGPADRLQSSYEPAQRPNIDIYHHPMPLPAQRPKPSWPEQPSVKLKESATKYRGPKPSIPYLVHKDPSEFARLKLALHNLLPEDASELFKFQILVDHLQLEDAKLIADSFLNSPYPYTETMAALTEKFGKPHQLALSKIARVMDAPDVRPGDPEAFERFALQIQALVGLLKSLGPEGDAELKCGSHVVRLLTKLPPDLRAAFRRQMLPSQATSFTLPEFSKWLQAESWCQSSDVVGNIQTKGWPKQRTDKHKEQRSRQATVLHGAGSLATNTTSSPIKPATLSDNKVKGKAFCPYCEKADHFLSQCINFQQLTTEQVKQWIQTNKRCWKCGRSHLSAQCNLRKSCNKCKGKHLLILHDVNYRPVKDTSSASGSTAETLYLDKPGTDSRVLLKVVRVLLRYNDRTLDTYAILDNGSERTILLFSAAQKLNLKSEEEELSIRTIHQEVSRLQGSKVSFSISPEAQPHKTYHIKQAFTTNHLGLAQQSYPMEALVSKYKHLKGLPIQSFDKIHPLLLIGADQPHLITPIEPVNLGPPGGPAAIKTRLGWTLQGPAKLLLNPLYPQQVLLTSLSSKQTELMRNVAKLWELDILPYRNEKQVTRSREDQVALEILNQGTVRVDINGIQRYATPLLRKPSVACLNASEEAVMPLLRRTERHLLKDPERAETYSAEIKKLVDEGYVAKADKTSRGPERWFIPHHMVTHNGKNRLVFNCSFQYQGMNLNESLLPGPVLSPSLLGVLIRFREHSVAVSGDVKGMFHQVRLLEQDRPILRFLWRDMERDREPDIFEWQVLPFGTTCSPCCASYALHKHVLDNTGLGDDLQFTIQRSFYVDNCLQSLNTTDEAQGLTDHLRALLASGGFDIRQWASNQPEVVSHLPKEAQSTSTELWLSQRETEVPESTLGLHWHCPTDTLRYKHRPLEYGTPTMRNLYRILASQYDPLGFIIPYTTRAKILIQKLWDKPREWDDPLFPDELLQSWLKWEDELKSLSSITFPRCYETLEMDNDSVVREIHVFCDASERAYGAVSYLRTENGQGKVELAFLIARSRVAPKKQLSVPRRELCAALCGAQLAEMLRKELSLEYRKITL